jgi:hypothetical protein
MFIEESNTVDVVIYYRKLKYQYLSYSESEFENEEFSDEDKAKYKKLIVKMRQLTWGLYNDLQEGAVDLDQDGNRRFNYKKYKESRLIRLLSGWDATVKQGDKEVPARADERSIKKLAPEIAESILNAYDQVMFLGEEEEGK